MGPPYFDPLDRFALWCIQGRENKDEEENPMRDHAERILTTPAIAQLQGDTRKRLRQVIDTVFADETLAGQFTNARIRHTAMAGEIIQEIWRRLGGDPELVNLLTIGDTTPPLFIESTIRKMIRRSHRLHLDATKGGQFGYDRAAKGKERTRRALIALYDRYFDFSARKDGRDLMRTLTKQTCLLPGGMTGLDFIAAGLMQRAEKKGAWHAFVQPDNSFSTWPSIIKLRAGNGKTADIHNIKTEQKDRLHLTPEKVQAYYKKHPPTEDRTTSWYITPVGNPSGTKMTPAQLKEICEEIVKADPNAIIILDLVYLGMLGSEHAKKLVAGVVGNPAVFDRCIVLESFSKEFAVCGERNGSFFSPNADIFTDPQNVMMVLTAGISKQTDAFAEAVATASPRQLKKFEELHEFWRKEVLGLYHYLIKSGKFKDLFDEDQSHVIPEDLEEPINLYLCLKLKEGVDGKQVLAETGCLGVETPMLSGTYMRFSVGTIQKLTFAKYAPPEEAEQQKLDKKAHSFLGENLRRKVDVAGFNKLRAERPGYKPNLCNMNLTGLKLDGINLSGADLGGVYMCDVNLGNANLAGIHFSNDAFLTGVKFHTANFAGANFTNTHCINCEILQSDTTGTIGLCQKQGGLRIENPT